MPGIVTIESSCFIARFHVEPSKRETFLAIFNALWNGAKDMLEEQCNLVFYGWDRDETTFVTIESYKDENALAALRESEVFQTVVRQLLEQCTAPMELQLLRGMATGRDVFDLYPVGPSKVHPAAGAINVMIS
jgi:quinol monooxygenase YgiN